MLVAELTQAGNMSLNMSAVNTPVPQAELPR